MNMKQFSIRLKAGQDLKEEIVRVAVEKEIGAGVLLSIVGGLACAVLRMAGSEPADQIIRTWDGPFEIVGGTGTVSKNGCHLHLSISNREGAVIGGHLKNGCLIKYTAEVVIGILDDVVYDRVMDLETGFKELNVSTS
jgi:uncharacterized protein